MMENNQILVVDDAAFMRMMLKNAIRAAGDYPVLEAENGEKALEIYSAKRPALVFLDISMPGINGVEVLKRIRETDPQANVVMCSAIGQAPMIVEAIKLGAIEFIVKPFSQDQIKQLIEKVFQAREESR